MNIFRASFSKIRKLFFEIDNINPCNDAPSLAMKLLPMIILCPMANQLNMLNIFKLKETQIFKAYSTGSSKYFIIITGRNTKILKTHSFLNKILSPQVIIDAVKNFVFLFENGFLQVKVLYSLQFLRNRKHVRIVQNHF